MKINVSGKKLLQLLDAQKSRIRQKQEMTRNIIEQHNKEHHANGETPTECLRRQGFHTIIDLLERHVRRIDAIAEALVPDEAYPLRLSEYIRDFVDSPYDALNIQREVAERLNDPDQLSLFRVN